YRIGEGALEGDQLLPVDMNVSRHAMLVHAAYQSTASAPLTSIFFGSQPRSAQVPPNGRWSITATERPALRTRPAATCAAVPVPMTMRSNACISLPFAKPLAVDAETGQAETKDQRWDQDIIRLGQPGG